MKDLIVILIVLSLIFICGLLTSTDKEMKECLKVNSEATCNYHLNR